MFTMRVDTSVLDAKMQFILDQLRSDTRKKIIKKIADYGTDIEKKRSPVVSGILKKSVRNWVSGDGRIIVPQVEYSPIVEGEWKDKLGTEGKGRAEIQSATPFVEGTREDIKKEASRLAAEVIEDLLNEFEAK